jgi:hypothetical protein
MSTQSTSRSLWFLACALLLLALAYACASESSGPVQGWSSRRGPVIPHDTFPTDCKLCHEGIGWRQIRKDFVYDHERETGYALLGEHAEAECLRCHNDRGPVQIYAQRGCVGCHVDDHRGKLGNDCSVCHSETDWRPVGQVSQHASTRFPLVGAHVATACWACHPNASVGNFQGAEPECASCHTQDLAQATEPDHVALGWTSSCDQCHTPTTWSGGFQHTGFALTGQHASAACSACHQGGVYAGTPSECFACHTDDYVGARAPNHVAQGISTECQQCHGTNGWTPAFFSHAGISDGCVQCHLADYQGTTDPNHAALGIATTCEQCHTTNAWQPASFSHAGISDGCVQCHLADYQGTTDPNHTALGIATTCEQCHTTNAWQPASFSHAGISDNCAQCHLDDYQGTSDPNHANAGFPAVCELCHTSTTNWNTAQFDHDFPITSGDHKNLSCSDCHLTPSYQQFSCTHCHEHSKNKMDSEHDREPGYVWSSPACYNCHPNGKAD